MFNFILFSCWSLCVMLTAIPPLRAPAHGPLQEQRSVYTPFQIPLYFLWLHTKLHRPVPPLFQAQSVGGCMGYLMGRVISVHPRTSPRHGSRGFDHSMIVEGLMASERARSINLSHHDKIKSSIFNLHFFTKLLHACITSPWTHIKF